MSADAPKRVGVVGARGHAGGELLRLIAGHGGLTMAYAASRAAAGSPLQAIAPAATEPLTIAAPEPEAAAEAGLDVAILAMPNGLAGPFVEAFERRAPETALIDLSADFRFDDDWAYGLPEHNRAALAGARRIANPGCYATAAQLALKPLVPHLAAAPSAFGVSGYSGAGTTPSPRNDPKRLADSLMPYALNGHGHEREIRRHLTIAGADAAARTAFSPHVAGFFRGLSVTAHATLTGPAPAEDALALFERAYGDEPMLTLVDAPPEVRDVERRDGASVHVAPAPDEGRVVVVAALDNLLKGAASQALQNINLALGFPEAQGLIPMATPAAEAQP